MRLTRERLKELFDYDPDTGIFTRRMSRCGNWPAGSKAGGLTKYGHVRINIDGRLYLASNLAWLWMTGDWPEKMVDHKDNNHSNDRWANLRLATNAQNQWNRKKNINNSTGYKGVFRSGGRFRSQVSVNGKKHYLGYFDTAELAHAARQQFAEIRHGEFARAS